MSRRYALLFASVANFALGCAADSGEPRKPDAAAADVAIHVPALPGEAMGDAYAALMTENYAALPDLIARLDAAFEQDPEDGRLALYAGTMRLWHATGGQRTLGEQFSEVTQAIKLLERGRELQPDEPHIGAFLGVAKVAFGNTTGNQKNIEEGKQMLEATLPLYPAYVNGVLAQALGMLPRDHAFFSGAKDAIIASARACGLTGSKLEALELEYPESTTQGTCWNGGIVAHVWEGNALIAGDIFVKSGDVERARRAYQSAKTSPSYAHWPFTAVLDRRIADADARTALYLDDDKDNDPPTWMQEGKLCVGCHAHDP